MPETPYTPRAGEPKPRPRLTVDGALVRIRRRAAGRCDGGVETAHRLTLCTGEPGGFRRGDGDGNEAAEVAPREHAVGEGAVDGGQIGEPLDDARDLLQLPAAETETLPRIIVYADEAEPEVPAAAAERPRQATEDAAAEGLLAGEAAEERIDELGAEISVEASALLRGRRLEHLRWDEIGKHQRSVHRKRSISEHAVVVN